MITQNGALYGSLLPNWRFDGQFFPNQVPLSGLPPLEPWVRSQPAAPRSPVEVVAY